MTATGRTKRERGTGAVTRLPNGRFKATLVYENDPLPGRKRRVSANGRTRSEAMERAKAKLSELIKEDDPTRFDHMPTIGEWCTRWVEDVIRPRRSPNTYRTYETRIRCGIIPAIGRIRVDRIRPSHARLLEKKETEHNRGATARLTQTVLTLALDDAVREGLINRNPLYRMDRPALDPREIIPLDPHDACRLIRLEPDPSWRLLWRLMFVTGMRLGEATGITPSEIVESEGRTCVLVEWQLKTFPRVTSKEDMPRGVDARHMGGDKWLTRPKTRNGRRLVPLPPDLAADLKAWAAGRKPDELIFTSRRGNPLTREGVRYPWARALERAGLPYTNIHSMRHTAATMMAHNGVPDLVRKKLIGHADIDTTDMIYTHTDALMLARAVDGMEKLINDGGKTWAGITPSA